MALMILNNISYLSNLEETGVKIIPVFNLDAFSPFMIYINILIGIDLLKILIFQSEDSGIIIAGL